ncbi:ABC transporter permease [Pseudonocardia acaciae]|uniref:ABC transporter permease n=1 Tax=Pseudonocardia acaciae TaxID=551276 RepID=UPI00049028A7|nr:ABC transporter permease [Pseudonocardia acaciae]
MTARAGTASMVTGLSLVGAVVLASAVGHFTLSDPNLQTFSETLRPPSPAHLFGTDDLGRDVIARTLAATWLDLALALGATAVSVTVGIVVGTLAGYLGGWPERVSLRVADFVIAFPFVVLVLVIIAIVGPGPLGIFAALTAGGWAYYARISRAELLVLRERQFIQAAHTLGFSPRRVMFRHALPNLLRPGLVYSMSDAVMNILFVAALSFLGLGVRPPTPEWGAIISDGQAYLLSAWWITTLPGVVLTLVGLGFTLIGDALGERLGTRVERVAR